MDEDIQYLPRSRVWICPADALPAAKTVEDLTTMARDAARYRWYRAHWSSAICRTIGEVDEESTSTGQDMDRAADRGIEREGK